MEGLISQNPCPPPFPLILFWVEFFPHWRHSVLVSSALLMAIPFTSLILDEISGAYFVLFTSLIWFLVISFFFFWRLCFYLKDIHPTIFKEENKVTFTLPIWHCVLRHMDKRDCLYMAQVLLPVSERLWFLVATTAHDRIDGNVADPTRLSGFVILFHLSQNSRFLQPPGNGADIEQEANLQNSSCLRTAQVALVLCYYHHHFIYHEMICLLV